MKYFRKSLIFIFYFRQNQLKIHLHTTIYKSIPYSFRMWRLCPRIVRDKYINSKSKII